MTLPPNYGPEYVREFESAYKDLAQKYKLRLIPFLMEDILAQLRAQPGLMQRDGIHPTAKGHAIIADTVFRYFSRSSQSPDYWTPNFLNQISMRCQASFASTSR